MRAVILDLDGTLVDAVYDQTLAWQRALHEAALHISSIDQLGLRSA